MPDSAPASTPPPLRRGFLQPAHGWAAFATEIVIVVFGVLIALGAQQAVDAWQTRRDLDAFRAALRTELSQNLGAYAGRIMQSACIGTRLDQLEAWQRDWRDGSGPELVGTIGRPLAYTLRMSVWRGGSAVAAQMPLDERLAWAGIYDDFESYDGLARAREAPAWWALFAYDGAARLSPAEVNTLRGLILSARSVDRSIQHNWPEFQRQAAALGVVPVIEPDQRGQGTNLCEPMRFVR